MLRILSHVLFIIFLFQQVHAQDKLAQPISRHILMVNKTHETIKEVNIGDAIKLKLIDATKVKGHITSIDSTFLTVDSTVVHINEITNISMKKEKSKKLRTGGVLIACGIAGIIAVASDPYSDAAEPIAILSLGLT